MKPTRLITFRDTRRNSFDRATGKCHREPFTDYSYHSGALEQSSAYHLPVHARSFWSITRDYFKYEARQDFRSEAALFAIITITAALPLINNMHALIEFLRAISSH